MTDKKTTVNDLVRTDDKKLSDYTDLVKTLAKHGDDIVSSLSGDDAYLWHSATGICTEAGELLDAYITPDYTREIDWENVIEELGDIEFYLEMALIVLDISEREITDTKEEFYFSQHNMFEQASLTMLAGTEFLDLVKRRCIYNKEVERAAFAKALTKIYLCLVIVYQMTGLKRIQVLEANKEKLAVRYNGLKYTDNAANGRADKNGEQP